MIEEDINKIFDNCYSKDLSVCPKHTIFQRQKALNEIISYLKRERIARVVDRELPENRYHPLGQFYDLVNNDGFMGTEEMDKPETDAYNEAQMDMVLAGYVTVEEL